MSGPVGQKSDETTTARQGQTVRERPRPSPQREPAGILALQQAAGNQAVGEALGQGAGRLIPAPGSLIQRQPASEEGVCPVCGRRGSGQCPDCGQEFVPLQRSPSASGTAPASGLDAVRGVLRSGGKPLGSAVRSFMESRFGADFGRVRVHMGGQAADSARAVHARAYTVGQNIAFAAGRYEPETARGRQLLAHELAHTIQSKGHVSNANPTSISKPGDTAEREASDVAAEVQSGEPVSVGARAESGTLLRDNGDDDVERAFTEYTPPPGQVHRVPTEEPLTPEEMYRTLTSRTAFREGVREQRILRHGSATRAVIQVIDRDGNRVALEFGRNDGRVHAEEDAIRRLRRQITGLGDRLQGGRMVVVVNQHVCQDRCAVALRQFAEEFGLERVNSHVFVRQALRGQGRARPRQTFTTQTSPSVEGRELQRVDEPIYQRPPGGGPDPQPGPGGGHAGQAPPVEGPQEPPPKRQSGLRQRLRTRFRRSVGGVRRSFRGSVRSVRGRGIGVLVGLAASYVAGIPEQQREEANYEAAARSVDAEIEGQLGRLEAEAAAVTAREDGATVYANVSITEAEVTYSVYDDVETDFDGLTLDYIRISATEIAPPDRPRRSHRSDGSIMGSGVYNYSTQEYSIPLNIEGLLSHSELQQATSQVDQALSAEDVSGLELQYLNKESIILRELSDIYEALESASGEELESLGQRILNLHERLASAQELRSTVLTGETYTPELVRDINQSLRAGNVPDVEAQMLEEERVAFQQAAQTEQELSTQSIPEDELQARSEEIVTQRRRASRAARRRARQATTALNPKEQIAESEARLGRQSVLPEELARMNEERNLLLQIAEIDEELSRQNFPEDELRRILETRDQLLEELAQL